MCSRHALLNAEKSLHTTLRDLKVTHVTFKFKYLFLLCDVREFVFVKIYTCILTQLN